MEQKRYLVDEDGGVVRVCVVVQSRAGICVIPFPIIFTLSTSHNSGIYIVTQQV